MQVRASQSLIEAKWFVLPAKTECSSRGLHASIDSLIALERWYDNRERDGRIYVASSTGVFTVAALLEISAGFASLDTRFGHRLDRRYVHIARSPFGDHTKRRNRILNVPGITRSDTGS